MGEIGGTFMSTNYTFNLDCLFNKIDTILNETPNPGESKIFLRAGSTIGTSVFHFKKETIYGTVTAHVAADTDSAVIKIELAGFGEFMSASTDKENCTVVDYDNQVDFCTKLFLDEFVRRMKLWFC